MLDNLVHELFSNALNLFTGHENPSGYRSTRTYDFDHGLSSVTDAEGQTVGVSYSMFGTGRRRIASIGSATDVVSYTHNKFSVDSLTNSLGKISYEFVGNNPVLKSYENQNASYRVLLNGRGEAQSVSVQTGDVVSGASLSYNVDSELTGAGPLNLVRRQEDGAIIGLQLQSNETNLGYNEFSEITALVSKVNGVDKFFDYFARDNSGKITARQMKGSSGVQTFQYQFDQVGRLTKVSVEGDASAAVEYTYDARGNRISATKNQQVVSATYDTSDVIISYGDLRFEHNRNGEMTEKRNIVTNQVRTFTYDVFHQLTRVTSSGGQAVEYLYDAEGNRSVRKIDGEVVSRYLHDFQGRLVGEYDGNSNFIQYVYASQQHSPDFMYRNGSAFRFVKDHLGSVRSVIHSNGTLAQEIVYDEFGGVKSDSNPGFQSFGFAGGVYDPQTGLVKFGLRSYDAEIGRWTSPDPILFDGGDTNLYAYVANDPVNAYDPGGDRIAVTGSMKQQRMLWLAIQRNLKSAKGKELYKLLHSSDTEYEIRFRRESERKGSFARLRCNLVVVDPADLDRTFRTEVGTAKYKLERILAHEMGHLTGTRDDGPNRMNNVNEWENPISTPLDGHVRTGYGRKK